MTFCPTPPLLIGDDPPERPAGPLSVITGEIAGGITGSGLFSGGNVNTVTNIANMGVGTVYLVGWLLSPSAPAGVVGIDHTMIISYNGVDIWRGRQAFAGEPYINPITQFSMPHHDGNNVSCTFASSSAWDGSYTILLIAIRGATAYHAVSPLVSISNNDDPLFGVIRNDLGDVFYADYGGVWGSP